MSQPTSQALTAPPPSELAAIQAAFAASVAEAAADLGIGADAGKRLAEQVIQRVGAGTRMTPEQVAELLRQLAGRAAVAASGPVAPVDGNRAARRRHVATVLERRLSQQLAVMADQIDGVAANAVFRVAGVDPGLVPVEVQIGDLPNPRNTREAVARARRRLQHLDYDVYEQRMRVEAARIASDQVTNRFRATQQRVILAHPDIDGWRRRAHPGACLACLALADGTVYRTQTMFHTHGRCKCTLEPVTGDSPPFRTGQEQWDALTPAEKAARLKGRGGAEKAKALEGRPLTDVLARPYGADNAMVTERPLKDLTGD